MGLPCLEGERGLGMRSCQCLYNEAVTGLREELQCGLMSYFGMSVQMLQIIMSLHVSHVS